MRVFYTVVVLLGVLMYELAFAVDIKPIQIPCPEGSLGIGKCICGGKVCPGGTVCSAGKCIKIPRPCPEGFTGVNGNCKCGDHVCAEGDICWQGFCMKADSPCAGVTCEPGSFCDDGHCISGECGDMKECPSLMLCLDHKCVRRPVKSPLNNGYPQQ